jgi:hypothetical protein
MAWSVSRRCKKQAKGKSALCMALAAHGQTIFCDDVLPIEPRADRGFAIGIAPRLRKPLPGTLGSRLLRFIAERTGPADRQWVYVKLGEGELAPLGDVAPIKAFVLLRRGTRRTRLEHVSKNEMLEAPVCQIHRDENNDVFLLIDGMKIAKRGLPDSPHANTWIMLEPGWMVRDVKGGRAIEVYYERARMH